MSLVVAGIMRLDAVVRGLPGAIIILYELVSGVIDTVWVIRL